MNFRPLTRLTVKVRLTLWYVLVLAVILIIFSGFLYGTVRQRTYSELETVLRARALQVSSAIESEDGEVRLEDTQDTATGDVRVAVYDLEGRRIVGSVPAVLFPETIQTISGHDIVEAGDKAGGDWYVLTLPLQQEDGAAGWVRVAGSMQPYQRTMNSLLRVLLLLVPLTLLAATAGGYFLAQKALSPIDKITRTAQNIGQHQLSLRIEQQPTDDELGRLTATINRMLDRLEAAFERQRRFTADASHELRTPIAVIQAQAEQALGPKNTPGDVRHALEVVREQTQRMGSLVRQLLVLARSDANEEPLVVEAVDVEELAAMVVNGFQEAAEEHQIQLSSEATGHDCVIKADQGMLVQLVSNLIENALKYTPTGGYVRVEVECGSTGVYLSVIDNGVGIPREKQARVFERFYRVDEARSREHGGTGLGLAICRAIALAHGGSIKVSSNPGGGSIFTVWLPANQAT